MSATGGTGKRAKTTDPHRRVFYHTDKLLVLASAASAEGTLSFPAEGVVDGEIPEEEERHHGVKYEYQDDADRRRKIREKSVQCEFGISDVDMAEISKRQTKWSLFSISDEKVIVCAEYLCATLNIPKEAIPRLLKLCGNLFTCNIETNLKPKIEFYAQRLELHPYDLGLLVDKFPQLLTYRVEKIEEAVRVLRTFPCR